MVDIIVYGGGFQAVAAVAKAAKNVLNKLRLVIRTYTVSKSGEITAIIE